MICHSSGLVVSPPASWGGSLAFSSVEGWRPTLLESKESHCAGVYLFARECRQMPGLPVPKTFFLRDKAPCGKRRRFSAKRQISSTYCLESGSSHADGVGPEPISLACDLYLEGGDQYPAGFPLPLRVAVGNARACAYRLRLQMLDAGSTACTSKSPRKRN